MAVAEKVKVLDSIISWMTDRFDGNISSVAIAAAEMAKKEGLVSGPLWDEVGSKVLHIVFRERMTTQRRQGLSLQAKKQQEGSQPVVSQEKSFPFHYNGRWYQLFDMSKAEVESVAAYYNDLAESNGFERDFLLAVAGELKDGEIVRDKFNVDGLLKLRQEIADRKKI